MFDIKAYLEERAALVDKALAAKLPRVRPARLHEAMRYAVLAGGKRIRPILCMAAGECVKQEYITQSRKVAKMKPGAFAALREHSSLLTAALAIEVLHTYTLIHDDLPCMDDDDLRRGKPTVHKAFGEAEAVLAGDALLTLAFEWLAEVQAPPPYPPNQLAIELARAAGSAGVIGGQFEDIRATGVLSRRDAEGAEQVWREKTIKARKRQSCQHPRLDSFHATSPSACSAPLREKPSSARETLLRYIQEHKTGALITASVRIGAITGGANRQTLTALTKYGERLGAAFQAVDDILNATSTPEQLGKAAGTDQAANKLTCVSLYGLDGARVLAARHRDAAIKALSRVPSRRTEPLVAIAKYVVSRSC